MASRWPQLVALDWQLLNSKVTQFFGPTTYGAEPAGYGYAHFHSGVDLVLPTEPGGGPPPIRSFSSGKVVGVIPGATGYGNHIVIQSPNGYTYLYGHLHDFSSILYGSGRGANQNLQVGDIVHAGDILGHEGTTGNSSGVHLHLEVRDPSGIPVDLGRTGNNIFYSVYHDLGFGMGYLPGQLDVIPDPTQKPDPGQYLPVPNPLPLNPAQAAKDIRFAFGKIGIFGPADPTSGQPVQYPTGTPGNPTTDPGGATCPDGSQPPCYITGSPVGITSGAGSPFFSFLGQPGGILGAKSSATQASILTGGIDPGAILVFIAAAFMGGVFIIVGLVKLGQEKPVAAVVQPVIQVGKTGGKLAAAAA